MEVTLQKSQLLGKVHRKSLYPLYEQVFGIPAYILQDYKSADEAHRNPEESEHPLL